MIINITRPLKLIQWSSYILFFILIDLVILIPLAFLIFDDFYSRLLPSDSSQWVPISAFHNNIRNPSHSSRSSSSKNVYLFSQKINRISSNTIELSPSPLLPSIESNGLEQQIALREEINYLLDLNLEFFCLNNINSRHRIDSIEIDIFSMNMKQSTDPETDFENIEKIHKQLLYHYSQPIICLDVNDSVVTSELHKQTPKTSSSSALRLAMYEKEWMNTIHLQDVMNLNSSITNLVLRIKTTIGTETSDNELIFKMNECFMVFNMNFSQGLRNIMLKKRFITYVVGTVICFTIMSLLLFFSVLIVVYLFSSSSRRLKSEAEAVASEEKHGGGVSDGYRWVPVSSSSFNDEQYKVDKKNEHESVNVNENENEIRDRIRKVPIA
ncbi:seipin NDAI_0J02370 [Naumovozyma dairenensis CBS 421]|uniref:Seipin n=1 Tax=Naumovozyma dairenensis (strain ATCC 10597 / BCRC 20456 / CBS 421 / NBRC 0211 / NRRL Y-12639) TaxID=1071378 RepID=G0WH51_NAUDC|nr:hypothetical protein NDAI_0J02370 [Naumovozyma dairenensis CBS 421]CCD27129.1 hypothetical protein NDAI_0J02370 [Naumovozyma dairenensis CBS 421]